MFDGKMMHRCHFWILCKVDDTISYQRLISYFPSQMVFFHGIRLDRYLNRNSMEKYGICKSTMFFLNLKSHLHVISLISFLIHMIAQMELSTSCLLWMLYHFSPINFFQWFLILADNAFDWVIITSPEAGSVFLEAWK